MTEPTDNVPPEPPAEGTDNVDKPDGGDTSPDIPTLIKDADAQQLKELIEYLNNSGEVGTGDPKDLPFFNSKRNPSTSNIFSFLFLTSHFKKLTLFSFLHCGKNRRFQIHSEERYRN